MTVEPSSPTNPQTPTGLTLEKGLYLAWTNFLSLTGLVGYVSVSYIIIKYRKTNFNNSFFTLALSLAVCDVTTLFLNFVYVTPTIIFGAQVPYWYDITCGFINLWLVFGSILHMVVISFNRLAAVVLLQTYQFYFTTNKLILIIGFCYGFSLITALIVFCCGCTFGVVSVAWEYTCLPSKNICEDFAMNFVQVQSTLIFFVTFFVYLVIVIRLRKIDQITADDQQRREMRKEKSLVFQFGMVCLVYFVYLTIFWFIFGVKNEFTASVGQWILGTFALFHCCLNPFLYMTFGSEIKRLMFGHTVFPVTMVAPSTRNF